MTTENNKLIAEFMGMITSENDSSMMIFKTPNGNDIIYLDELKYHTSWDWLMPVVYKILWLEDYEDESYEDIHSGLTNALLSQTYEAVVEFIKEHNTQIIGSFDSNGDLI